MRRRESRADIHRLTPDLRVQFSPGPDAGPVAQSHMDVTHLLQDNEGVTPMSYFDSSLLKACARALKASRMIWSQNAMQARSWRAVSKMIDMYTQVNSQRVAVYFL